MKKFVVDGLTVVICHDGDSESPREWDNIATMVHWHRNYDLCDRRVSGPRSFLLELMQEREWREHQKEVPDEIPDKNIGDYIEKYYWILPLFLYDHSGLSIRVRNFDCSFDSGQVGFIYIDKDDERLLEVDEDGETREETARRIMKQEVKTYDQYLTGDVYWYCIENEKGNVLDSCGDIYGFDNCKKEATEAAKVIAKKLAVDYVI